MSNTHDRNFAVYGQTQANCNVFFIGVREGGAGGAAAPPIFLRIYLFGQKLSCHSGNDVLVTRRIY